LTSATHAPKTWDAPTDFVEEVGNRYETR
jgi:hypothetical protein